MKSDEFTRMYWSQYISLEKEFAATIHYLALDEKNDSSYSQAYSKLMLEIGSEVDVVFKEYCRTIDPTFKGSYKSIGRYKESISNCNPDFIAQFVDVKDSVRKLQPWIEWNSEEAPFWWTAYNKVKHSRTTLVEIDGVKQEGYKFANQKYTLLALAGLYQIMVYFYQKLASDEAKRIVTPMPGSRIFELSGGMWDSISFYGDSAFYIDEETGNLFWVTSSLNY